MDLPFQVAGDTVNDQVSESQCRSLLLRKGTKGAQSRGGGVVKARENSRPAELTLLNVTCLDLIKDLTLAHLGDGELVLKLLHRLFPWSSPEHQQPLVSVSLGNLLEMEISHPRGLLELPSRSEDVPPEPPLPARASEGAGPAAGGGAERPARLRRRASRTGAERSGRCGLRCGVSRHSARGACIRAHGLT